MKSCTIRKKAEELVQSLRGFWEDVPESRKITDDLYGRLIEATVRHLKVPTEVLYPSAVMYIGRELNKDVIFEFAYRCFAHLPVLKAGTPSDFAGYVKNNDVEEIQFLSLKYKTADTVSVRIKVMTGTAALRVLTISCGLKLVYVWMRILGYTGRIGDPYIFPPPSLAIPGLYAKFKFLLRDPFKTDPKDSTGSVEKSSLKTYNRQEIIAYRNGIKDCPFGLNDTRDANENYCALLCPHGRDTCPASGHSKERPVAICSECGKELAIVDNGLGLCVNCYRKKEGLSEND